MKISPAQRKVLEQMAAGDEIWTNTGRDSSAWFYRGKLGTVSLATLHALARKGAVAAYESEWRGSKYRITEAGRKALT